MALSPKEKVMLRVYHQISEYLDAYLRGEATLGEVGDRLLSLFPSYYDEAFEEDYDLICEVLAGVYEVRDGVMAEESFRRAIEMFLRKSRSRPRGTGPL